MPAADKPWKIEYRGVRPDSPWKNWPVRYRDRTAATRAADRELRGIARSVCVRNIRTEEVWWRRGGSWQRCEFGVGAVG